MVLCWTDISGYMSACWRALAAMPDVDLHVIAFSSQGTFSNDLMSGLNCRLLSADERNNVELVHALIAERRPDVLYLPGWFHRAYRKAIFAPQFDSVSKWLGADTPWLGTLRQQAARVVLRRLIARVDRVFVAGERAWQYLRVLGAPESHICRGLYGIDFDTFHSVYERRQQQERGWPHRFLYAGRYVEEKALDVLTAAYRDYRRSVSDPWPLASCGAGPLGHLLQDHEGIENLGFQQPAQLAEMMLRHGAFILPSRFEPWGVVVAEAGAAGMPVLCTEACGASVELVRPYYNGLAVATDDAPALARAMRWMHEHADEMPEFGERAHKLAEPYGAHFWATRWRQAALGVLAGK